MARFKDKIKAQGLRRKGLGLKTISKRMGISKSTISLWCRDIVLTETQQQKLKDRMINMGLIGRLIGAETNKQKKIKTISNAFLDAKKIIGLVTNRDLLFLAIGLFWGEGSKTGSRFIFINSDPAMIKLMKDFLEKVLEVAPDLIRVTVQINLIHKPRINTVLKFWSNHLDLPLNQFTNPYYVKIKPKKVYENYKTYNGILRLSVLRGSLLQYKMLGLMEVLKKEYMSR